jgi:hypothetical protein
VTVVLWASAFVAIRSDGRYFSPGALALGRMACAAVVLGLVSLVRREGWPPRAAWPGIAAFGVLWFGVYMIALDWGEQKVDAGTAAMIVNIGPVIIALLAGRCAWRGWRCPAAGRGTRMHDTGRLRVANTARRGSRAPAGRGPAGGVIPGLDGA